MSIAHMLVGRQQTIIHCTADEPVHAAVRLLAEKRIGALPVLEGEQLVGIFSERDVLYALAEHGAAALDMQVRAVMTSPAITITPDHAINDALALMTRRRVRHLPVLEGGRMVAFISIGDLVKHRIDEVEAEARQMRDYITSA